MCFFVYFHYSCNSKLLDKITLQSQHCVSKKDLTSYSVACLYDGKFCISSLRDSVSFLPIFDHVEKNNVKVKSRNISTDSKLIFIYRNVLFKLI